MNQHNNVALDVSGVTKKFVKSEGLCWPWKKQNGNGRKPVVAVDSVAFEVWRGEIFGILGPNGSGKSTLVRCIATLLLSDEGRISVFGHDVLQEERAARLGEATHQPGFGGRLVLQKTIADPWRSCSGRVGVRIPLQRQISSPIGAGQRESKIPGQMLQR